MTFDEWFETVDTKNFLFPGAIAEKSWKAGAREMLDCLIEAGYLPHDDGYIKMLQDSVENEDK